MEADVGTVSVGLSARTPQRARPRGLYALITHALGKEILVLGPSTAGKTKFTEYLRFGVLDPEGKREMTYRVRKSPAFTVGIGQDRNVVLKVRRAVDTPGQVGPIEHATLVGRRKPHAIIVVLDSSRAALMMTTWLHLFCDRLDTVLRRGSYARRKLAEIIVLLNKRDKIGSDDAEHLKQGTRRVLNQHLSVALGAERVQAIPILECISIQTTDEAVLINHAVSTLAERLAK